MANDKHDILPPYRRGAKNSIFDARATAIGIGLFALICLGALAWRVAVRADLRRTAILSFEFGLTDHSVEDFRLSDPVRGIQPQAAVADRPDAVGLVEEKPSIHMTASPVASDVPVYTEVIQSPNATVATPNMDLSALAGANIDVTTPTDANIIDGPEEITVVSDEVGYAIPMIAVEVEGPADIFKYNTPPPRDRPALYTFNQGPRPGRNLKLLPQAFGPQDAPSFGTPGPMNINLFGSGDFLRSMERSGGLRARSAVDSALHWLAVHQGPDGLWHADTLEGQKSGSLADTGLAMLAFMGGGNTTRKGEYRRNVLKGLEAILRNQKPDGHLTYQGTNFYTHAICTIALCEAYGRARDERIGAAAQRAIDFCLKNQAADGGWRYGPNPPASDMSVTAWFVQALKTARLAQLRFDQAAYARALVFVDSVTDQGASQDSNGAVTYMFQEGQNYPKNGHPALTAAGMMVRQFSGVGVRNHILVKGADLTRQRPPDWKNKDFYYWYYATYAMHNMGGEHRIWWNQKIRDVLLENQSREGDNAGSWDPKGDKWGAQGGRPYVTALGALCLEVYYRYSDALNSFGTAPELDELLME